MPYFMGLKNSHFGGRIRPHTNKGIYLGYDIILIKLVEVVGNKMSDSGSVAVNCNR